MEGEWTTIFFQGSSRQDLMEGCSEIPGELAVKNHFGAEWYSTPMCRMEHVATIRQEGPAWLNREMQSSNVKRRYKKGGSRDRLSGKKIETLWEHDRGKYGWNRCERQKGELAWIVMTLWTYTSSRDSPHTEFLLHTLIHQPHISNTEMAGTILVGK